jgi:Zn-dependent protease
VLTGGWRVGRIAGVDIYLHPSLLIIAALVILSRWTVFSSRYPELQTPVLLLFALAGAALFFGSILAHEMGHALVSKARHIDVLGITLLFFGGLTQSRTDSRRPLDEFLITVVGPLVNAVLGAVFYVLAHATVSTNRPLAETFDYLSYINFLVAIFNLLPGFPLDGGRVLRSIVWRVTGSQSTATRVAGRVGQAVALGIIGYAVLQMVRTGDLASLWLVFIGSMLLSGATAALSESTRRKLLEGTTAGEVMSPPPPTVPPDMPLAEATPRYLAGHEGEAFPVIEGGRLLGFVSPRTARAAPSDARVRDAIASPNGVIEAARSEPLGSVTSRLGERGVQTVLVFDDGRLVGVIEPEDLRRFFRQRA